MNFGKAIDALIAKQDLSGELTFELFSRLIRDDESRMNQGAFLAALTSKGATEEEIAAIQKVIYEFDTVRANVNTDLPLAENSGTGMDHFKTFNISTAASIVAASCGVAMSRHGSRAITSSCGTVDVAEALGVSVDMESYQVAKSIEKCGIGLFNGMSSKVHPVGLGRILGEINFGTVLNIAASLANPVKPQYGVRGVNDPLIIDRTSKIMHHIGYERSIVLYGFIGEDKPGMDEASSLGRTVFTETDKEGNRTIHHCYPEDFGIPRGKVGNIAAIGEPMLEARRLACILSGEQKDDCVNIVLLNAAFLIYVSGLADDLLKSFHLAEEALFSGKSFQKLEEWVSVQQLNDPDEAVQRLRLLKEGKLNEIICS